MSLAAQITAELNSSGLLAMPIVLIGGVVASFNPCCLPMIPTIVALVSNHDKLNKIRGGIIAAFFVTGFAASTALMGAMTTSLGLVFGKTGGLFYYVLSVVPLAFGLHLLGVVSLKLPQMPQIKVFGGYSGSFLTGALFALVIVPCSTPILASILIYATTTKSVLSGSLLLFVYGIGAGVPLIIMGSFMGFMGALNFFERKRTLINRITGALLIITGLYIIWIA